MPRLAGVVLIVAIATVWPGQAGQNPPFKSGVEVITLAATVRDRDGRLIKGLPRGAFAVWEDGEPQPITQFARERVPVSLGLLLDISDSMYGQRIKDGRAAVERFLFQLLNPADEFFVLAFNHKPHLLTGWTNDPAVVRQALDGLRPSGGTAEYDAVIAALPVFQRRTKQRAALLIISDGADTASDATLRDVRSGLLRSDAYAYAIAIDPPEHVPINTRVNPAALQDITDRSGGRTEIVRSAEDLSAATASIAEELNNQYVVGYNAPRPPDGQYHSVSLRVTGTDYRVRTRTGYVAVPLAAR